MIPIVAFTGPSGSGKTTLIEKVIINLALRGIRVGTIKHHLKPLEVDKEGKDSWRHKAAGAFGVVISTPSGLAAIRSEEKDIGPREIAERFLFDADIVIVEGCKTADLPNIAVHRKANSEDFSIGESKKTIAVASDIDIDIPDIPRYSLDDSEGISELIVKKFIETKPARRVSLFVNDKTIPMKDFVRDLLEGTIRGLIGTFRGTEGAKKITIVIDE